MSEADGSSYKILRASKMIVKILMGNKISLLIISCMFFWGLFVVIYLKARVGMDLTVLKKNLLFLFFFKSHVKSFVTGAGL